MYLRQIGETKVSALGLGGMPMSIEGRPEESRSIATIHAALDAGITLIDTADAYHEGADEVGHNESLIARALASYGGDTSEVLVATKGGHLRPRTTCGRHARRPCAVLASTPSGSTSSTGRTRACPTRTRSGRSATSSTRA
jgi:aryl-alcohol dehydrogenase-like predicted oxidoreductase